VIELISLSVALGRFSSKRVAELCSASLAVAESSHLAVFDPEVEGEPPQVISPCEFESGWLLRSRSVPTPEQLKEAVKALGKRIGASSFIFNDSPLSFWISSLLAGELKLPVITDAVKISREGERIIVTKPLNRESVWGDFEVKGSGFVAIIRRGFPENTGERRRISMQVLELDEFPRKLRIIESREAERIRLNDASVVFGIGDGVRQSGALELAIGLAEILNAEYGCTKPLVESGLLSIERLIGVSGKRISPKVYIALGISGSVYHLAGVSASGTVISINLDRSCPMNRSADYFYAGDLREALPRLIELLKGKDAL